MAGRPQLSSRRGPTYQLAEFMDDNWERMVGRTNEDVAQELGYRAGNIVSMWRTGKTRVALERLPDIARLMKVDLGVLMPMWFEQYWGDRADMKPLMKLLTDRILTDNEARFLDAVKTAIPGRAHNFTQEEGKVAGLAIADPDVRKAATSAAKKKGLVAA